MIIQSTFPANPAAQPDLQIQGVDPLRAAAFAPARNAPVPVSSAELNQAVAEINQAMQASNRNLEFSVDTSTRKVVVKMMDTSTGELIRQFPSEATLAIARGIDQFQQGLLVSREA